MTLSFTEQERIYIMFILAYWDGLAPYDGTVRVSNNPSRAEAEKLMQKFLTPEERKERHE